MFKFRHKIVDWYGYEITEAECNCDYDNKEVKTSRMFNTEKKRDDSLQKHLDQSVYCIKLHRKFCKPVTEVNKDKKIKK